MFPLTDLREVTKFAIELVRARLSHEDDEPAETLPTVPNDKPLSSAPLYALNYGCSGDIRRCPCGDCYYKRRKIFWVEVEHLKQVSRETGADSCFVDLTR